MEHALVVGTGAVAQALVPALTARGVAVALRSRSPERAARLAAATGTSVQEGALRGGTLLLAVPDRALAEVAQASAANGDAPDVALHLSGFHDAAVLQPLADAGVATGFAHPLGSFPRGGPPIPTRLTWCCGGATPAAAEAAMRLVQVLEGTPLPLGPGPHAKARYHAAASLVAGGSAALLQLAEELAGAEVTDPSALRQGLCDLLASMLANARATGPAAALTGPAARGDEAVVAGHLEVMGTEAAQVYRSLLEPMRRMAAARAEAESSGRPGAE